MNPSCIYNLVVIWVTDWRLCDDSRVSSVGNEKNIMTRGAYLLFYRRRDEFTIPKEVLPNKDTPNRDEDSGAHSEVGNASDNASSSEMDSKPTAHPQYEYISGNLTGHDASDTTVTESTPLLASRNSRQGGEGGDGESEDSEGDQAENRPNAYRLQQDLGYMDMDAVD